MVLRGITVILYEEQQTGTDEFNRPVVEETPVEVGNVLVQPSSSTDVLDTLNLTGHKEVYQLAIPKGDTHDWADRKVGFFGQLWHTIGAPLEGIGDLIPLAWNKKVRVERYGG